MKKRRTTHYSCDSNQKEVNDEQDVVVDQEDIEEVDDDDLGDDVEEEEEAEEEEEVQESVKHSSDIDEDQIHEDRSISVTLTDPDLLNCFICHNRLRVPVIQCKRGHTACYSCCLKKNKICPACSMPIGSIRCSTVEKMLRSLKASCPNAKYGCLNILSFDQIKDHQDWCIHESCFCPYPGCDVVASSVVLSRHFSNEHEHSAMRFDYGCSFSAVLNVKDKVLIFQSSKYWVLFVLNNYSIENVGNVMSINFIGPKSCEYWYKYEVRAGLWGGCVQFESYAERNPTDTVNDDMLSSKFLFIPSGLFNGSGHLELEICIKEI